MGRYRVLVVDDRPDMQWITTAVLERTGIDTYLACDGAEALALLASNPLPDVVSTDLDMPVMTGERLVAAMAATPRLRGVPIIVASSGADLRPRIDGVFATFTRPFDSEAYAAKVIEACQVGSEWRRRWAAAERAIGRARQGIDELRQRLDLPALSDYEVEAMASGLVRLGAHSGDHALSVAFLGLLETIVGRDP